MQPQQPTPNQNPYEFIMSPGQVSKKPLFPFLKYGKSGKGRILMILGGILTIFIVLSIVISVFTGGKDNTQQLLEILQEQTEIVRVTGLAKSGARNSNTLALAASTSASVSSTEQQLTVIVKKKHKIDSKILALKKNSKTDQKISIAGLNNDFDEVFTAELTAELQAYQRNLKAAYDTSSSKTTKQILQTAYNGVNTLLGPSQSN